MPRPIRSSVQFFVKFSACVILLAMVGATSVPRQSALQPEPSGNLVAASDYYPMVHLRKLHLVRPDLIPYPVYFAVYC